MIEDLIDFIEIHPIVAFEAIYEPMLTSFLELNLLRSTIVHNNSIQRAAPSSPPKNDILFVLSPAKTCVYSSKFLASCIHKLEFKFSWSKFSWMETWMQNLYRVYQALKPYNIWWTYGLHFSQNENVNLLVRIKFLNLFLYRSLKKTEKCTGPNKILLVFGRRTAISVVVWGLWSNVNGLNH